MNILTQLKSFKTIFRHSLLCLLMALVSCNGKSDDNDAHEPDKIQNPEILGLKDINSNIQVGATFSYVEESEYLEITTTEFNTSQILFYAGFGGWPSEASFDLSAFNKSINWLNERDIAPHIHMLFGPDLYMPEWLKNGSWTPAQLDTLMQTFIQKIMDTNQNKSKVDIWNVINELFTDYNGTYRSDMIWNQMGMEPDASGLSGDENINNEHPIFIRKAFEYCRAATDAKLEYRDYLIENNNPATGWDKKHKAVYQLMKHLIKSEAPIDAIGIQGHFNIGEVDWILENNGVRDMVEKFKNLGLEVYITEMDIGTQGDYTNEIQEQQKTDFYTYSLQAIQGGANRIYTWGVHDGRDPTWKTDEHPLLWDANLKKKKAYDGIKKALEVTTN